MEAVICLSIFVVVSSIWAVYKIKKQARRNQDDRGGCFLFFFQARNPILVAAYFNWQNRLIREVTRRAAKNTRSVSVLVFRDGPSGISASVDQFAVMTSVNESQMSDDSFSESSP